MWTEKDMIFLENFLSKNHLKIISFDEILRISSFESSFLSFNFTTKMILKTLRKVRNLI